MKMWKIFLSIGVSVLIIGIIIFIIGLGLNGWNLRVEYEMKTYTSTADDTILDLDLSAGEMNVGFYDGDVIEVEYPDSFPYGYDVGEKDGKLYVHRRSNHFIWFGWNRIPAVTVRIPNGKVMDLNVDISAGTVRVADGEFASVKTHMSAGTMNLGKLKCGKFVSRLSAGRLDVAGADCTDLDLHLSAGSAKIDNVKCDNIKVKLSAGSVNLGIIGNKNDYEITVDKSAGSCNVSESLTPPGFSRSKFLDIDLSAGSVNVSFTD